MDDLERVLAVENLDALGARLESPDFDAVPREVLRANRDALLAEIHTAQEFFSRLVSSRPSR